MVDKALKETSAVVLLSVPIVASAGGGNRVIITDEDGNLFLVKMSDEQLEKRPDNIVIVPELEISPDYAAQLATAILAQDPRAKTAPGAVRTLAAMVAVLGNPVNPAKIEGG